MRVYPVRFYRLDDDGVVLRLRDVPEAVACGGNEAEALDNARPILEAVLQSYLDEGRPLPDPSPPDGAPTVATDRFEEGRWRPLVFAGRV